jgi:outer membrane protein OmpA-like peptidoglycan-associated protein/Tol biopolymer transport system component
LPLYLSATLFLIAVFCSVLISNQLISIDKLQNSNSISNSTFNDYAPSVTEDERIMVFNSKLTPESNYDIFVSYNENNSWSTPKPFTEFNSTGNDETPYITPNGKIIVFSSDREGSLRPSRTSDGVKRITYDIYISYFVNGQWTAPRPVLGNVNTIQNERTPSITRDGKYLYFSRWRFGAIHESKIMRAENVGGQYVNCIELPYPINTGNYDIAFTPTHFGGFFFASQRQEGFGGWDIYYTPSDEANTKILNMGKDINSNSNDMFLTVSKKNVYLTSDRIGSMGDYNIFWSPLLSLNIPKDIKDILKPNIGDPVLPDASTSKSIIEKPIEEGLIDEKPIEKKAIEEPIKKPVLEKTQAKTVIAVTLLDQLNNPVSCETMIELFSNRGAQGRLREIKIKSNSNGEINIYPRDDVKSIKITTLSPNIVKTHKIIDAVKNSKIEVNILVEDSSKKFKKEEEKKEIVKKEETINFRPIYFSLNSSDIKVSSMPKLHQVIQYLREHPNKKLEIIGHADESGTAIINETLSNKRAASVKNYIVKMKINPNRLETIGVGSSQPAIKTKDKSLHRFNRRVEFKIYE